MYERYKRRVIKYDRRNKGTQVWMEKKRREIGKKDQGSKEQNRESNNRGWSGWGDLQEKIKKFEILEEGREKKKRNNIIIQIWEVLKRDLLETTVEEMLSKSLR